ncbi:MAG TPA: redoxin domain-containing protein [Jiangellaceae bacterium]|nr:redoxin domain-containing protein [Jiangellaceae bacterium]
MHRRALVLVVSVAAVALAACGSGSDPEGATIPEPTTAFTEPPAGQTTAPAPTPTPPTVPVPDVLDFTAQTVDGGTFDGSILAGRPAVVWFWAPWCPVCKRGAADVTSAAAELGGAVAFVGVAGLSGSVDDMQAFVEDTDTGSIPQVADVDGAVFTRFEVVQQDTFAFIGTDGTVELVDGYASDPDIVGTAREFFGL